MLETFSLLYGSSLVSVTEDILMPTSLRYNL